jgi:hypothetical protein
MPIGRYAARELIVKQIEATVTLCHIFCRDRRAGSALLKNRRGGGVRLPAWAAFSPAVVMPRPGWAKRAMMAQPVSIVTVAVVVAAPSPS